MRLLLAAALCLGVAAAPARAQTAGGLQTPDDPEPYYFYRALPYGSESLLHPLRLVVNGGYGILQLQNRDKRLARIDYSHGLENVWKNLSDPFGAIQSVGWGEFLQREILPVSFNRGNAQYWPNYMQHLIGGGMSYRLYCEWYRWHGFQRPRLMSGLTLFGYHLLNEVVEASDHQGWNVDPVADFYVFNVLGVVLFSSDSVSRFFSGTLHMADWSYQPAIDPRDGSIVNNGQNFVWKLDLPWTDRWRLFYHWGTHAEGGLSWRVDEEWSLSGGLGLKANELVDLGDGFKTVDLAASAGIFLDRNNSLMASLVMAHTKDYRWRVNLYPGLVDMGPVSPGLFAVDSRTRGAIFGITLDFLPVLPVGLAFSGPDDDPASLSSRW